MSVKLLQVNSHMYLGPRSSGTTGGQGVRVKSKCEEDEEVGRGHK